MGILVEKSFFTSKDDVLIDIRNNGTWPTTFVSPTYPGVEVHWLSLIHI